MVLLPGTAAGGGAEADDNVNTSNSNVADEFIKSSSPSQQPDDTHHDVTAAPGGQYSVLYQHSVSKVLPKPHGPIRAALISVLLALGWTPAEAARPRIRG